MSIAYNKRKKALKAARSVDEKRIDRKIRTGEYPRFVMKGTASKLPRVKSRVKRLGKLSWAMTSTKVLLLDQLAAE